MFLLFSPLGLGSVMRVRKEQRTRREGGPRPSQIQLPLGLKDFSNLGKTKIQTFPPVEAAVSAATKLDFVGDPPSSGFHGEARLPVQ